MQTWRGTPLQLPSNNRCCGRTWFSLRKKTNLQPLLRYDTAAKRMSRQHDLCFEVQFLEFCFEWLPQSRRFTQLHRFFSRSNCHNYVHHLQSGCAGCFPDRPHDQHRPSLYRSKSRCVAQCVAHRQHVLLVLLNQVAKAQPKVCKYPKRRDELFHSGTSMSMRKAREKAVFIRMCQAFSRGLQWVKFVHHSRKHYHGSSRACNSRPGPWSRHADTRRHQVTRSGMPTPISAVKL